MKDPQTKKQIFKNRRDQGIQILREYVEKNQKYLTIRVLTFFLSLSFSVSTSNNKFNILFASEGINLRVIHLIVLQ